MRIGLISDTHIPEAGTELPKEVFQAFEGVDLIMHAGDMHVIQVLDWLEVLAPVVGALGNGDVPDSVPSKLRPGLPPDARVKEAPVVVVDGLTIGMVHYFPVPGDLPWLSQQEFLDRYFTERLDVVVCGHTHHALVVEHEGLLIVNPGSPTFPDNMSGILGNVGILEVNQGKVDVHILSLRDL